MKNPDRNTVNILEALPNVGKSIAKDLYQIGIDHPQKLIGQSPFEMYDQLCQKKGMRVDPCVIDVFISAVYFMEGGEPRPWWEFTAKRKRHYRLQESHMSKD
jgi:hypothetical protein